MTAAMRTAVRLRATLTSMACPIPPGLSTRSHRRKSLATARQGDIRIVKESGYAASVAALVVWMTKNRSANRQIADHAQCLVADAYGGKVIRAAKGHAANDHLGTIADSDPTLAGMFGVHPFIAAR